jgi:hypothetical protein
MENGRSRLPPEAGTFRFGSIAVDRQYVTLEQVQNAIDEQFENYITGSPHRLLGEILMENYLLTEEQVKSILEEMGGGEK